MERQHWLAQFPPPPLTALPKDCFFAAHLHWEAPGRQLFLPAFCSAGFESQYRHLGAVLKTEDASVCGTLTSVEGRALVGSVVADFVMNTTSFTKMINKGREGQGSQIPYLRPPAVQRHSGDMNTYSFLPPTTVGSFLSFSHFFFFKNHKAKSVVLSSFCNAGD